MALACESHSEPILETTTHQENATRAQSAGGCDSCACTQLWAGVHACTRNGRLRISHCTQSPRGSVAFQIFK